MDFITSSLHYFYSAAQDCYPDVLFYGDRSRREIALTFDDGPHPHDTPRVLDVLARHDLHVTFFLIGRAAERHSNLVKQIHEGGHELGIHCDRHIPFPFENAAALRGQLERTRHIIADACGIAAETIKSLRPPYGAFTRRTLTVLTEWGFRLVMWSCIPPHWMQPVGWSIRQVMEAIVPGAVIVLHDGHGHGARVADILEVIIPRVKSLGYEFITVEEMQNQRDQLAASS